MGRLHSKGKGISASAVPYSRTAPAWLKTTPDQVVEQICKLARKGATPSQIGVVLRDSHGVAQVKLVTGNRILRILKSNGLAPELPEDLYMLIKKAVSVRKHLERNRKDKDSKFRLILIESRIHRLARYYKTVGVLPLPGSTSLLLPAPLSHKAETLCKPEVVSTLVIGVGGQITENLAFRAMMPMRRSGGPGER
uniref:Small ribosomal subunit protein uS15 N-terminal domain-containing protein n=1 Tax=Bionectria ochroleuca TaxID=29856 RepID=A0A8H7N9J8_BIOOC